MPNTDTKYLQNTVLGIRNQFSPVILIEQNICFISFCGTIRQNLWPNIC